MGILNAIIKEVSSLSNETLLREISRSEIAMFKEFLGGMANVHTAGNHQTNTNIYRSELAKRSPGITLHVEADAYQGKGYRFAAWLQSYGYKVWAVTPEEFARLERLQIDPGCDDTSELWAIYSDHIQGLKKELGK
jgi:hypothetical protein